MVTFNNEEHISQIIFRKSAITFCPIADGYNHNHFTISIRPDNILLDYQDIDKYFNTLEGKPLTIEAVTGQVFRYLWDNYSPKYLQVCNDAESNLHMNVQVIKEETKVVSKTLNE